ncbi:MAG: acyloxyacyl hydrolase [Owenweeksia sp.]|nr:acyloxyacyl hydrolase [Owenweeksia sp.]
MVPSDYQSQALGHTYALIPYVENTLPVTSGNIGFYYHLGLGLGYHSTIFDSIVNPANEALSTHFNIAFDLRAGLEWQLNPSLRASLSVGVLHYSNGAVRKPNFGVNLTQLHAGLAYDFPHKLTLPVTAEKDGFKDSEWLLIITAGKRQVEGSTRFYPVQALSAERNWSLGRGDRFGVGLSYMNDAVWEEYQVWGDRLGSWRVPTDRKMAHF